MLRLENRMLQMNLVRPMCRMKLSGENFLFIQTELAHSGGIGSLSDPFY